MKKLFILVVAILALASIVAGKVHWDNKIEATTKNVVKTENTNIKSEEASNLEESEEKSNEQSMVKEEVLEYTKNLPDEIVAKIENAIATGEPVHLAIMGSVSTAAGPNGWPTLLKQELLNTYGEAIFKVSIKEIADTKSTEIVANRLYQDVIDSKPDILLFEPFILEDNGYVELQDRFANFTTIINDFKEQLPDITILVQPANPLHNATFYPKEIAEFKTFVENSGYIYLNHWEAWPDPNSPEMANYLLSGLPNDLGHQVWAEYLIDYFIFVE